MSDSLDEVREALEGRYAIERELGSGGMAVVYLAKDLQHGRSVAVKILRSDIAACLGPERFVREIRILSQLTHPNILPLYDSGRVGDRLFYVMPRAEGGSLRDTLKKRTFLPLDEVLRVAAEVGEALDFAHSHGIVHRDIKPENILNEAGHAVVADFGIARAIDVAAGDTLTSGSLVVGTPAYMSPEQGSGQGNIDGRSDIYSLACVVYEMIAGNVPYQGPTPDVIHARKALEPMPPIRTVRPTVPAGIEEALRRGLAVIPADRFSTAGDFVAALRRPARPRRWRTLALGAAATVTAVTLALLLSYRARQRLQRATHDRVAVAEFVNRTGDSKLDAVGFMAADWITEGLQRTRTIEVVPMLSALEASLYVRARAESGPAPPNTLGVMRAETGADIVVSGSFYRSGDTLTFQSQVTDVRLGKVLVAIGPVLAPVANPVLAIGELRTRAMGFLASANDERLAASAGLEGAPPTYEAYQEFSAGMFGYVSSDFESASAHLMQAYQSDSTYPTPLLFASISLSNQGRNREADSVAHILDRMRGRLNPFYQDWLDYRLAYLAGDRPRALLAVRRLAGRAPGTKATYNLAVEALENGYLDEAISALKSLPPDRGPMRGWIPYWELLGTAYHLKGDYKAELRVGAQARSKYPGRLFALLPSVRALAALARTSELDALLRQAGDLGRDPYGTSPGSVLREAGDESLAHGQAAAARTYFARSLRWYTDRMNGHSASHADSMVTANLFYALGAWKESVALVGPTPAASEDIGLLGLLEVRLGRSDEGRRIALRLGADRSPYQFGGGFLAQARIAGLLRDTMMALNAVENAFKAGREYDLWIHRTPELALLRSNRRFQDLVTPKR